MIRIREGRLEVPNTVKLDGSAVVSNSHQLLHRREPFPSLKPEPTEGCTRTRNLQGRFDRLHAREPVTCYYVRIGLAPACTPSWCTISIAYGNSTLSTSVRYCCIPSCLHSSCCATAYALIYCGTSSYLCTLFRAVRCRTPCETAVRLLTLVKYYIHRPGIYVSSAGLEPTQHLCRAWSQPVSNLNPLVIPSGNIKPRGENKIKSWKESAL